jgi:hypothetical protein
MTEEDEDVSFIDEDASPSCRQNISTTKTIGRQATLAALLLLLLFGSCCWFFRCSLFWMSFSSLNLSLNIGLLSQICVRSRAIEAMITQMICDAAEKILRVWWSIASVVFTSAAKKKSQKLG